MLLFGARLGVLSNVSPTLAKKLGRLPGWLFGRQRLFALGETAVLGGARGLPLPEGAVVMPDEAMRRVEVEVVVHGGCGREHARAGGFLEKMGGNGGGSHRPTNPGEE